VCLDDTIVFSANAQDNDGGVRNVTINGEVVTTCVQGNLGQQATGTIIGQNPAPAASPGDEVSARRFTAVNVPVAARCQQGFSLERVSGRFSASALNFYGGRRETAAYSFTYPPTAFSCIPASPRRCSPTQQCCGTVQPDGSCDGQCWPRDMSCP
jgi:hypothetical protein